MRNCKFLLPLMLLLLLLSACIGQNPTTLETKSSHGNLPNELREPDMAIRISTDKESYSLPIKQLHLTIENAGSKEVGFHAAVHIEKLEEGTWYQIPYKNMSFTDIGMVIAPGKTHVDEVPIDMVHYQLQPGTYRVLKEFYPDSGPEMLAAEFEIE